MWGAKPRNDMKIIAWYYGVINNKPLTHDDNPIEFRCKYVNKRRESIAITQYRSTNSSGGYLETDSTIEFKQNGKIIFNRVLPTVNSPFVKVQKEGIESKFKDGDLNGDLYGLKRNETQVIKFG